MQSIKYIEVIMDVCYCKNFKFIKNYGHTLNVIKMVKFLIFCKQITITLLSIIFRIESVNNSSLKMYNIPKILRTLPKK